MWQSCANSERARRAWRRHDRLAIDRRNERGSKTTMPLSFPNKSRAFDATRRAVRFWGYDSAMEAAFFVTEDALKRVQPVSLSETYALKYWWCSPPRTGIASGRPTVWTARGIGASLCSDRCVRASL